MSVASGAGIENLKRTDERISFELGKRGRAGAIRYVLVAAISMGVLYKTGLQSEGAWLVVAFAVLFAYLALFLAINHEEISIDRDFIRYRNGPLPFPGNRMIKAGQVRSLALSKTTIRRPKKGLKVFYTLEAVTLMNERKLICGFNDVGLARAALKSMADWMKIPAQDTSGFDSP